MIPQDGSFEQQAERAIQLKERWKPLSFPLQLLLQEHLKRYGLEAAQHMTFLLEHALMPRNAKEGG